MYIWLWVKTVKTYEMTIYDLGNFHTSIDQLLLGAG